MCPIEAPEEEATAGSCSPLVLGRLSVDRSMRWAQLSAALAHTFASHLQIICGESQAGREEAQRSTLGLGPSSISSILIGEETLCPSFLRRASLLFCSGSLSFSLVYLLVFSAASWPESLSTGSRWQLQYVQRNFNTFLKLM